MAKRKEQRKDSTYRRKETEFERDKEEKKERKKENNKERSWRYRKI